MKTYKDFYGDNDINGDSINVNDAVDKPLYKIGDYIYFWMKVSKKKIVTGKVKIIDIEYIHFTNEYAYLVTDGISEDKQIGQTGSIISANFNVLERHIKRLLTPYEIEDFKLKSNSKKYNL